MYSTHFLDLPPLRAAGGSVTLPGSKSISNRLLLAALSSGVTTLHDLLDSDDTRVMLSALRSLGCTVTPSANTVTVEGLGGTDIAIVLLIRAVEFHQHIFGLLIMGQCRVHQTFRDMSAESVAFKFDFFDAGFGHDWQ